jgi:hypothetical protein
MSHEERLWLYEKRLEEIPLRVAKIMAKNLLAANIAMEVIVKTTGLTVV